MPELTRQDIKEVFIETLEPFAQSVQKDFQKVNERLDGVDKRFDGVDKRLDGIESRLTTIENEWAEFRKNSSELFTKLDKFISLYESQKIELASLANQMARLNERVGMLEAKLAAK